MEPNMSFLRGAVCRRRNYKLDLNKQTAAAWPPLQELFGGCCWRCLLALLQPLFFFSQTQSQKSAHRHVLYRVHDTHSTTAKPCYHARPHMHCILPNDNSSKRINITHIRSEAQTYNFSRDGPIDVNERIFLFFGSDEKEEGTNTEKLLSKLTISSLF